MIVFRAEPQLLSLVLRCFRFAALLLRLLRTLSLTGSVAAFRSVVTFWAGLTLLVLLLLGLGLFALHLRFLLLRLLGLGLLRLRFGLLLLRFCLRLLRLLLLGLLGFRLLSLWFGLTLLMIFLRTLAGFLRLLLGFLLLFRFVETAQVGSCEQVDGAFRLLCVAVFLKRFGLFAAFVHLYYLLGATS